ARRVRHEGRGGQARPPLRRRAPRLRRGLGRADRGGDGGSERRGVARPVFFRPSPRHDLVNRKLLVIDDEEDIREVASLTLELQEGWDVAAAGSGADGIRLARGAAPDAILLDVMMPDMDG